MPILHRKKDKTIANEVIEFNPQFSTTKHVKKLPKNDYSQVVKKWTFESSCLFFPNSL